MCRDVDVPALGAQGGEVGDGRFRSRQDDEVGVAGQRPSRLNEGDRHVRLGGQRVEVVEVGDTRQPRHGDANRPGRPRRGRTIEDDRVLRRQPAGRLEPWHHAEARQVGALGDDAKPVAEQARIAAELVDDVAAQPRPFARLQHRPGTDQAGDRAAAVDVGDEHDGNAGRLGEAHVGDVAVAQVDLRRAAGALDEHQVTTVREPSEAFQHSRQQGRLQRLIIARLGRAEDAALHHHLRADLGLRLEQHGVHVGVGWDAARARLQRLGATDLAAVGGDGGVVRHVLRLERPNIEAAAGIRAGQPGRDQRLTDVGAGALQHQSSGDPAPGWRPPGDAHLRRELPLT
jgi:hypothetical protein